MKPDHAALYPHARRLFAAYVNQDYDAEGRSVDDAIALFAEEAGAASAKAAASELARLLEASDSDRDLARALDALRCGYDPAADGSTDRAFVRKAIRILRRA